MPLSYLQNKQKSLNQQKSDFYTSRGLHVYIKEPLHNEDIDLEKVISKLEGVLPGHLLSEIEMIVVGWFDEFETRDINAFYRDGALYVSNIQNDSDDIYDDLVHETAHSLESLYGHVIYADEKIKDEFLRKRKYLHDTLWAQGFKAPLSFFADVEYNKEFDMFLYEKVGYDKLSSLMLGLFINPYAATSLQEYFATGFTEFYINSDHKFLQKISPELYKKINLLHDEETLDKQL